MSETVRPFSPANDDYCYRCHCRLVEENCLAGVKSIPPFHGNPDYVDPTKPVRASRDALRWIGLAGYFSDWDNYQRGIVLCDKCLDETLGKWMRYKDTAYPAHYERRRTRDEDDIKRRWQVRQQKRVLQQQLPPSNRNASKPKI